METRDAIFKAMSTEFGCVTESLASEPAAFRDLWTRSGLNAASFADRLATTLAAPRARFDQVSAADALAQHFSPRFLREFGAYPFLDAEQGPTVAIAEPPDPSFIRAVEVVLSRKPAFVVASYDEIETLLADRVPSVQEEELAQESGQGAADDVESLRDLASGAPVVRALNDLFDKATELRATDLHIEPMRETLVVRFRVDGILRNAAPPPVRMAAAIISRIKILAGLNIAERRIPQDGSARLRTSTGQVDVRVAIMPTAHGESAVLRFLPRDRGLLDLSRVGLGQRDEATLRRLLHIRNGLIIITGPTGSGKTTTLAGSLTFLNDDSRKILTIEDPIEYELAGVVQAQVNAAVGLTFASALRAFLRLDPNVIMVGEIRDGETAGIAVQAALTGHLVLTTLHTETAAASVPRLIDLGVDDFLLQSTIRGVVAQRLVRVLCPHCKRASALDQASLDEDPRYALLGFRRGDAVWRPIGCDRCGQSGYRGRRGVFEVLEITPEIRQAIRRGVDASTLEAVARQKGFRNMMDDAAAHCRLGETSVDEVFRVTSAR